MFNINAFIKFINVNNDEIIQKSEIRQFVDKLENPGIFNNYFNSIINDADINTVENDILDIVKKANTENEEIDDFYFKNDNDYIEYQKLVINEYRNNNNGYFPYSSNWSKNIGVVESFENIPDRTKNVSKDARGCDITKLNLSEEQLLNLCIDKTTVMTPKQKAILKPYMEAAKNPGLGIRELHEHGITGKGINIAVIDQPLGIHKEYADNIIGQINDINCAETGNDIASMHGAAVASTAVGKNTGTAPGAGLVYYSASNISTNPEEIKAYKEKINREIEKSNDPKTIEYLKDLLKEIETDKCCLTNKPYVEAINKILDENEKLPKDKRVSVISISYGFPNDAPGYEEFQKAVQRAKNQGVFIVSPALFKYYDINFYGANRNPKGDLDNPDNYEAGAFWKHESEEGSKEYKDKLLLVPMDHRTVADFTDENSYRYEGNDGGMSWAAPWLAGMYALAKQADSNITPEKFLQYALETSNECNNNDSGAYAGRIINPQGLIQKIQENKTVK